MLIKLDKVQDVGDFVKLAQTELGDVILRTPAGRWVIDGKSLLGIFSLDLSNPIELELDSGNYAKFEQYRV
jgi:hypothetical protein